MSFNERKNIVRKRINYAAKQMKDSISPFPDSPIKRERLRMIDDLRKQNLRWLDKLTSPSKTQVKSIAYNSAAIQR
jgi:hypothetical protein